MIVSDQHVKPQNVDEVRRAGHRPLQQLPLADHLGGLDLHVPARMLADRGDALGRGLAAERQSLQPPQPAPRDRQRDGGQGQADSHPHDHANLLSIRSSSVAMQALPRPEPGSYPREPAHRTG